MKKNFKYISKEDALKKLERYCAYQDRCHQEVRNKLLSLGVYGDVLEEIIVELIEDNFLNEERYARTLARGKFRIKKWGRLRIKQMLKQKDISDYCIRKAFEEIEEEAYTHTLSEVLQKKLDQLKDDNAFQRQTKAGQYAIRRGFEPGLVWKILKEFNT